MTKEMEFWMKDKEKQTILLDEEEKKSEVELEKLYSQLQVCLFLPCSWRPQCDMLWHRA